MTEPTAIPIRTLRNEIATIIRRVESGESFDITRHGRHVARITPTTQPRRTGTLDDLWRLRAQVPADPGYAAELRRWRDEDPGLRDVFADDER